MRGFLYFCLGFLLLSLATFAIAGKRGSLSRKPPLEIIPDMDLNEVLSILVMVDSARSLLMTHATRLTFIGEDKNLDQIIEENINQLRKKHALLAGILERIHKMDLKDTAVGLLGIDAMESLLKLRMLVILTS